MYAPTPDGEVYILRGIPLDADYKHTLYFASSADQYTYFVNQQKYWASHLMYIRETGRIRYNVSADMIDDCNYLMYRNQQYHDKWFYAFIRQVYYINDNCCEIEFEIDVIQTYLFDVVFKQCFIERNHTLTDAIGDNTVEENLNIGSYVFEDEEVFSQFGSSWDIIMYSTFDPATFTATGGDLNKGYYSALKRTRIGQINFTGAPYGQASFTIDPRNTIADIVNNHADKIDGVVAIVIAPTFFENYSVGDFDFAKKTQFRNGGSAGQVINIKNNKLFTAPYYVVYVPDGSGSGKFFMPNEFSGSNISFDVFSDNAPAQTVVIKPNSYKGSTSSTPNGGYTDSILMTGFPQCAWISDSFKQYLAQNGTNIGLTGIMGLAQVAGGIAVTAATEGAGAAVGGSMIVSGLGQIAGMLGSMADKSKVAPKAEGQITGTAWYSIGQKRIMAFHMRPKLENLLIIDDYFNMFGYRIHRVTWPHIAARPHWTYIKTVDANILPKTGTGLSASALKKFCNVFDSGVTFWKNPSEVGDYTLDNRPA